MKAYFLFENLELLHAGHMEEYRNNVLPMVQAYGGKYIVVGGNPKMIEGHWNPTYLVLIEFPSREQAEAWYHAEEYAPLKELRLSALKANGLLLEGLEG